MPTEKSSHAISLRGKPREEDGMNMDGNCVIWGNALAAIDDL
jgi:hypothetical protein